MPHAIISFIFNILLLKGRFIYSRELVVSITITTAINYLPGSTLDMRCLRPLSIDRNNTLIHLNPSIGKGTSEC